jgi:hypothetical protein
MPGSRDWRAILGHHSRCTLALCPVPGVSVAQHILGVCLGSLESIEATKKLSWRISITETSWLGSCQIAVEKAQQIDQETQSSDSVVSAHSVSRPVNSSIT